MKFVLFRNQFPSSQGYFVSMSLDCVSEYLLQSDAQIRCHIFRVYLLCASVHD